MESDSEFEYGDQVSVKTYVHSFVLGRSVASATPARHSDLAHFMADSLAPFAADPLISIFSHPILGSKK